MVSRFSKKHLFWLLPTLLLALLVALIAVGLALARTQGWQWQGVSWRNGPVLEQLTWRDGDCSRLTAADIRLAVAWPLQLSVGQLQLQPCASAAASGSFALPWAPPLVVTIQALQWRNYPAVGVAAQHHGSLWQAQLSRAENHLRISYDASKQRWQAAGHVAAAALRTGYVGTFELQGKGYWRPAAAAMQQRLGGQLHVSGQQLGRAPAGLRGDVTASLAWQGKDWTLDAALAQPLTLERGWVVQSAQGIHARGTGLSLEQANAALTLQGPQATAQVTLRSNAGRLGSGRGSIVFSDGVDGRVELRWAQGAVTLQPFTLSGPQNIVMTLEQPVTAALAASGRIAPELTLSHGDVRLHTTKSELLWDGTVVRWRGALALAGNWQGYALEGSWSGRIDAAGIHGQPLAVTVSGANLQIQARLPVTGLWPVQWPLTAQLTGHVMAQDFAATVSARPATVGWQGQLQAQGRLTRFDEGGELALTAAWQWQDGLVVARGAQLHMTQALSGDVLVEPVTVTATTPLYIDGAGVAGELGLQATGVTAARWQLPALQADITLDQQTMVVTARVPQWNGQLTLHGRNLFAAPAGTLSARLPLQPTISRGLGVVVGDGLLRASGSWRLGDTPSISARLQTTDMKLDWGSIAATGVQADLAVRWRPGHFELHSRAPVTVARVASGIAVTDIRFELDSDLETWRLHEVSAQLLGGHLSAPTLTWPSTEYQPVTLSNIAVEQIVALQSKPVVKANGRVSGTIPVRLLRSSLAIRNGHVHNDTPITLSIPETEGVQALKQTSQAVSLALDVISNLRINTFKAKIDMQADGWLNAAMTIKGVNPRLGQPIVLNYTHQENMFDLLRNLRISGRVVDAVVGEHQIVTPQ